MVPLVSCIIVVHNYEAYIETAVQSALAQQGFGPDALEVIVVDDGSTDRTPAVLASFGGAITVLRQENSGPTVATARALQRARGRYVALLDGDDEWLPDKLARQLALFERRPEVALVHGDLEVVGGAGEPINPSKYDWCGQLPVVGRALGRLLRANEATTSTIVLRTEVAKQLPSAPAWAWCRDWWIAAQVASRHEIDATREPVARYRVHGNNISAGATSDRAVKLSQRDVRVQRLLLRGLDLGGASLDEIAVALAHQSDLTRQVSSAHGIAPTEVLPVGPADRLAADELCARARELLDTDPVAAGRLAAQAVAADPFAVAGRELFESARLRPAAPSLVPASSAAHLERLRELAEMRDALVAETTRAAGGGMRRLEMVARGLRDLERVHASIAAGAPFGVSMPGPTVVQRERAFAALTAAVKAADSGDPAVALVHSAAALALDLSNDHARAVYTRALFTLSATREPFDQRCEAERIRLQTPAPAMLAAARPFVAIADAQELLERPALLGSWSQAFAPTDRATLAILSAEPDLAAVHDRLMLALVRAGIDPGGDHDLALLHAMPDSAEEVALAREAHALLTHADHEGSSGCLGGHPRAATAAALRDLAARRWSHGGAEKPLAIAIKICPPHWDGAQGWGDTHFARALADELRRRGHHPRVDVVADWNRQCDRGGGQCDADDVVIHLRGLYPYVPREGQLNVLWNISHPELVIPAECDAFDLIATPSMRHAERLARQTPRPIIVLEQATDPTVFFPERDPAHERQLVLVGNSRGILRPIIRDLLPTDLDLAVWGEQWDRFIPSSHIAGRHLPNDKVRLAYSSATIVLNDHWDDMRAEGIVSNRVYDALACGALVLSDYLPELTERFGESVVTYRTRDELGQTVARLLGDPAERSERAAAGRARVLAGHTFRHRIDALLEAMLALSPRTRTPLKVPAPAPIYHP